MKTSQIRIANYRDACIPNFPFYERKKKVPYYKINLINYMTTKTEFPFNLILTDKNKL